MVHKSEFGVMAKQNQVAHDGALQMSISDETVPVPGGAVPPALTC